MISNDVNHHPHILRMHSLNKTNKIFFSSKIWINFVPIKSSISMVVISVVLWNRWNPNSIKTHIFNIIEILLNSFESTSTVFAKVRARLGRSISSCKSISYDLIDCSRLPFFSTMSSSRRCEHCHEDNHT